MCEWPQLVWKAALVLFDLCLGQKGGWDKELEGRGPCVLPTGCFIKVRLEAQNHPQQRPPHPHILSLGSATHKLLGGADVNEKCLHALI